MIRKRKQQSLFMFTAADAASADLSPKDRISNAFHIVCTVPGMLTHNQ